MASDRVTINKKDPDMEAQVETALAEYGIYSIRHVLYNCSAFRNRPDP
ncbi:MAG: hypothetical protein LIO94_05300 [Clostridiales bacterium]|nr:hypothetical protein [Clostridiales bacterium]